MLGHNAILDAIEDKRIVINPFDIKQLGPNSYDLKLGNWIVRQKTLTDRDRGYFFDEISPRYLGERVDPYSVWDSPYEPNGGKILLRPGELILAHTAEYVLCRGDIVGEMASRSTVMRMGIAVCVDAGLGDVGFGSKWTMEIYNHLQVAIVLQAGDRVAQMKFHEVTQGHASRGIAADYGDKGGTYGQKEWTPDDMLPRSSMR